MHSLRAFLLLISLLLFGGCKQAADIDKVTNAPTTADGSATTLPTPQSTGGSITGMPNTPRPLASSVVDTTAAAPPDATDGDVSNTEITTPLPAPMPVELTADDAIALLRDYYGAINARDYQRAWRLWDDGGRASGQSSEEFAAGFAQTAGVSVEIGRPGDIAANAGQRHVRVPILVTASLEDGRTQRFVGEYVLHANVVDGTAPNWRIRNGNLGLQK